MKGFITTIASVFLAASPAPAEQPDLGNRRLSPEDVRMVAPALEKYTQAHLYGDIWKRPDLSRRDRSIVSLAVLITRNQFAPLNYYLGQALDNGVKPAGTVGIADICAPSWQASTRNHHSAQAKTRLSDSSDSRIHRPRESRFYEGGY